MNRQMRRVKKKGSEGQRAKPPTLTRAIDTPLIGDEEKNGKQERKKKQGEGLFVYLFIVLS